jgi:exosortase/archaeosortase family protein
MPKRNRWFATEEVSFFVKVLSVYGAWKLLHAYLWRTPESTAEWQAYLTGYGHLYASLTGGVLRLLGFPSSVDGTVVNINALHSIWIAEHCMAIPAMVIFGFSMLLFRGRWIDKAWFIPLGVLFIFFLNLFRLVSLSILMTHLQESTYQVYHRYVFLVLTYGAILAMVAWWMDRVMKDAEE